MSLATQNMVVALMHGIEQPTVYLNCGPLFHIGALMSTLATFQMGGTNVFIPTADPEEICAMVVRERCTRAFVVEPTRQKVVDLVARHGHDLSSLQA